MIKEHTKNVYQFEIVFITCSSDISHPLVAINAPIIAKTQLFKVLIRFSEICPPEIE